MFALVLQEGTLDNVTKTIGRLLDGYDIRLRPNFGGEKDACKYLYLKVVAGRVCQSIFIFLAALVFINDVVGSMIALCTF